ncbi:MAG TPA: di-heme oxidoredictase family protein [Planctomycetaceae bacterium]|nr:di-heme oxidoredictase family protein [Planctomycetaceae bacterium]
MLHVLSPVSKFCGLSALAVIGSGVLWCSIDPPARREVRESPIVARPRPPTPDVPSATPPDRPVLLQALDLPQVEQPAPPVVEADTNVPPATVDSAPPAEPIVATPVADPQLTASPQEPPADRPADILAAVEKVAATTSADEGRKLFLHQWKVKDPLAHGDGIGPVFNAQSCAECHQVRGLGGAGQNQHNVCMFLVAPGKGDPVVEGTIHQYSVKNVWPESLDQAAQVLQHVQFNPNARPDKRPTVYAGQLIATMVSTPSLWGLGEIDRITDADLRDLPGNYTSGRARKLPDGHVGKFGWKGQFSSLHDFVANACAAEIGLSNSVRSQLEPYAYRDSTKAANDLTDAQVKSLTDFVAQLPRPQEVAPPLPQQQEQVARGKMIFHGIGCAGCHVPDVGSAKGVYSDFKLHDVVDAQSRVTEPYYGQAQRVEWPKEYPKPVEWKTTPLWGLADTAPYWHDGTARTIPDAILKHSGEAEQSVQQFENLGANDQENLLKFLETMKAPANNPNPPPQRAKRK